MRSAAETVAQRGAAIIDLNMGCPVPKVCKTGAGAALIKDPDTAVAVARAAVEGSGLPVTVKLRSGQQPGETDGYDACAPARRGGRRLGDRLPPAQRGGPPQGRAGLRPRGAARRVAARAGDPHRRPARPRRGPGGVRAHRRGRRDARPRLARQPVAVRASCSSGRTENPSVDEILDELDWMMDAAAEHFGPERAARWMRKAYPWYIERLGAGKRRSGDACRQPIRSPPHARS